MRFLKGQCYRRYALLLWAADWQEEMLSLFGFLFDYQRRKNPVHFDLRYSDATICARMNCFDLNGWYQMFCCPVRCLDHVMLPFYWCVNRIASVLYYGLIRGGVSDKNSVWLIGCVKLRHRYMQQRMTHQIREGKFTAIYYRIIHPHPNRNPALKEFVSI